MSQHEYPGLGLDLRFERREDKAPFYPMGIHADYPNACSGLLLLREVAMMRIMDRLTDKPDWHLKVFDEEIASRWVEEALAFPNNRLWREIVGDHNGIYGSSYEVDISEEGGSEEEGAGSGEGGGGSEEDDSSLDSEYSYQNWDAKALKGILDRPSLEYCIKELRDKASFFKTSGLVPTLDADATVVKSDILITGPLRASLRAAFNQLVENQKDSPDWHPGTDAKVQDLVHPSMFPLVYGRSRVLRDEVVGVADAVDKWAGKGDVIPKTPTPALPKGRWKLPEGRLTHIPSEFWSQDYQWLPANVGFVEGGGVRFTSYINNLHPVRYAGIYRTVEQLIEEALPAWDFCLAYFEEDEKVGSGRLNPRFPIPDDCDNGYVKNWVQTPPNRLSPEGEVATESKDTEGEDEEESGFYEGAEYDKKKHHRDAVQPTVPDHEEVDYSIDPSQTLRERYASKGLQIIIKMATIELTPEKPSFPAGGWHVEGQMNEHIVGTAIYYLDSANITPSYVQFRMQTDGEDFQDRAAVGQQGYGWLERVYGTELGNYGTCLQNYGDVETKEGRLLAFPNVFQHRVLPFKLADPTKPGHRRIMVLWLVDPELRVISTANVPPQQREWWLDSAFAGRRGPLPAELMDMVREEVGGDQAPMGVEEARGHRERLMVERSGFHEKAEYEWLHESYSFCEH